jgi:hypothetical protein
MPDLSVESLTISPEEQEFMTLLAPLLGRSPRTLKRFVNLYRLIKVGLSSYDRKLLFVKHAGRLPDYAAILFLLAIDTGAPKVARAFFSTTTRLASGGILHPETGAPLAATVSNLTVLLDGDDSLKTSPDWLKVRSLLEQRDRYDLHDDARPLARWIPRVDRYSFHSAARR